MAELHHTEKLSRQLLDENGEAVCSMSLAEYPDVHPVYWGHMCFFMGQMSALMKQLGLGYSEEVRAVTKINGKEITWTLGSLLLLLNREGLNEDL